jgi:uncharacterized protein YndB with AHSA1/START domain
MSRNEQSGGCDHEHQEADHLDPADRERTMTRGFDAPRHLVFDAFSKPELVMRWLLAAPSPTIAAQSEDER